MSSPLAPSSSTTSSIFAGRTNGPEKSLSKVARDEASLRKGSASGRPTTQAYAGPNSAISSCESSMPDEGVSYSPSDESPTSNIAIGSTRDQDPRVKLPESPVGGKALATTTTVLGQDAFLQSNTAELPPVIAQINLSGESASLSCSMYGTPVTWLPDSDATHSLVSNAQVRKIERIAGVKRTGLNIRSRWTIRKSKISSWHLRCQPEIRNKQSSSDVSYHR